MEREMNDREVMDTENLEKQEINMQDDVTKKVMEVLNAMGLIQPSNAAVTFGATNATEHLELNQWAPEDVPIRMDFNDDNRKIDTAFFELNTNLLERVYPVGAIYMSVNATNPSTLFGGTWQAWGQGRVPLGMGSNGTTNYQTVNATGGAETHVLTIAQLPAHGHPAPSIFQWDWRNVDRHPEVLHMGGQPVTVNNVAPVANQLRRANPTPSTSDTGSNAAHNNMQPWITCFMWQRTA